MDHCGLCGIRERVGNANYEVLGTDVAAGSGSRTQAERNLSCPPYYLTVVPVRSCGGSGANGTG